VAPCYAESPLVAAIEDQSDDMGESLPPSEVAAQKAPDLIEFTAQMGKLVDSLSMEKANWQQTLEGVRNGVVQLRVVQEKFIWTMPYRVPMREPIFGSGWFIDKSQFGVDIGDDILVVTNAHVAKQAYSISVLVPELGKEPIPAVAVGVCVQRDMAIVKIKDPAAFLKLFRERTGSGRGLACRMSCE